jgi:hypothetical protein
VGRDDVPRRAGLRVLDPLFAARTPAGRRSAAPAPLPASGQLDPHCSGLPLAANPLHDAEGTRILLQSRVEQITVDSNHGALLSRVHQQGQVIGRDLYLIYVRFDLDQQLIALRPHLVRVIETPGNPWFPATPAGQPGR